MRHLEDSQRLDEELRRRPCDVLELLRGPVGLENVQQHAVMDPGEIEDAQALADRPSAKLVGRRASRLTTLGEVLEEGGGVVTPEPLVCVPGHVAPCWSTQCKLGRARPDSASVVAVIAGSDAPGLPGAAAAGTPGPLRDPARCGPW